MWEAIRANRRRSVLLILVMGIILVALGGAIGMYAGSMVGGYRLEATNDDEIRGALYGAGIALAIWLTLWIVSVYQGDRVLLRSARAREIGKWDYPQLWNIVEEMKIASGLAHMPKIYVIEDPAPNAFAVGRNPERAAVAVTSGLLRLLNRDELQGVIAHEFAHVRNLDIRFMTIAAVLVASVELLSYAFLRVGPYTAGARRSGGSSRGGRGNAYLLVLVLIVAILSPILVRLLYLATSRWREYLADASAARFTRFPDGLASALEKIEVYHSDVSHSSAKSALAALYIVNPVAKLNAVGGLFSTHPPTEKRIQILRSMGGRAGYVDYEEALRKIESRKLRLAALEQASQSEGSVAARAPSAPSESRESAVGRAREVADMLDRFANFLILPCACGMRIKVPPDYKRDSVVCPRCERSQVLPHAEPTEEKKEAPLPKATSTGGGSLRYDRREQGWEAFRCPCGQTIQLGPDYPLDYTVCVNCDRRIELAAAKQAA